MSDSESSVRASGFRWLHGATRSLSFWLIVLVLGVLVVAGWERESRADASPKVEIAFIQVTGEGPAAKAWYDGAQPTGVPLQDALDEFAKKGFHVVQVSETQINRQENLTWAILLERVGP